MSEVTQAVILLDPLPEGFRLLLTRDIAGLPLFHRLALTVNQAGMKDIFIISRGLGEKERSRRMQEITADPRFSGRLRWLDRETWLKQPRDALFPETDAPGFLLVRGNVAVALELAQDFVREAATSDILRKKGVVSLQPMKGGAEGIYLIAAERTGLIEHYALNLPIEAPVVVVPPPGIHDFWTMVTDIPSARAAEAGLIEQSRHHYSQWLDLKVSAYLSPNITPLLVKTPFTPSQLTLFGLLIGVVAGTFLAEGNYFGGLAGGLLAALTVVWDTCSDDVARLKFQKSEYGGYLDKLCDYLIDGFILLGLAIGVGKQNGFFLALLVTLLLGLGGAWSYLLITQPPGSGKGGFFKGTRFYDLFPLLTSRNFICAILLFGLLGKLLWFYWLAALGSIAFAGILFYVKSEIMKKQGYLDKK